jgi:hypothetical protein
MKENEIAKNMMLGHSCEDCDHRAFDSMRCKKKGKYRIFPKERICSSWIRDLSRRGWIENV